MSSDYPLRKSVSLVTDTVPFLHWEIRIGKEGDSGTFELGEAEFRFDGVPFKTLLAVIDSFDGIATVAQIAESSGVPINIVLAIVGKFFELGLASDVRPASDSDLEPEIFSDVCRKFFPKWKERLFSHQLWLLLGSGEASRSQFAGWLLESYHFIEGVNVRLSLAVAECSDPRVRPLFARHYSEEYDHAHFFLRALNALGLDNETVVTSRPLPSTTAILNFMRQCARQDPLQYAVCSGFLESTGTDRTRARTFFEYLARHYASDCVSVIEPLVDHVNLDEAYGHNSMMEAICQKIGRLPMRRASKALEAGRLLVETLELWSTDIMKTYDQPDFLQCRGLNRYRPVS